MVIAFLLTVAPALPVSAQSIALIFGGKIQKDVDVRDFLPGGFAARKVAEKLLGGLQINLSARYFEIYEKHEGKTYYAVTGGIMFGPCSKGNNILGIGLKVDIPFIRAGMAKIALAFCNNLPTP